MKFKITYLLVCLFALNTLFSFAQQTKRQPLTLVKYKENVKAPLTVIEHAMLKEVYANELNKYVLSNPQRLKDLKHLLRNRITIKLMPDMVPNNEKYKSLSEVGLFDSYNKNLKFDETYNKQTFNPLKYNIEYHGRGSRIYRIDNTDYFIIIKSQHQ